MKCKDFYSEKGLTKVQMDTHHGYVIPCAPVQGAVVRHIPVDNRDIVNNIRNNIVRDKQYYYPYNIDNVVNIVGLQY